MRLLLQLRACGVPAKVRGVQRTGKASRWWGRARRHARSRAPSPAVPLARRQAVDGAFDVPSVPPTSRSSLAGWPRTAALVSVSRMGLFDRLPPRPRASRVALWVATVVLVRAFLIAVYATLGDLQEGDHGTFARRLVDEGTAAVVALALLGIVAWGAARWPLGEGRWRRSLAPLVALFVGYSVARTVGMETLRWLVYPVLGVPPRDYGVTSLVLAIGHEMPNDLFYFALFVVSVELWRFWWQATERERREVELQRSLAEAQLTSLRLQLQPHFLFNALNTVSATMYDDPRRADTMLGELSELLRASLRAHRSDQVSLREEVAIARRYVQLQHARFGDRLEVTFDIPEPCAAARVPVFVLQPLVENAVRHGRVERLGRGTIRVTARQAGDALTLEVWDDGDGTAPAHPGSGLGLRATSERLRLLYGQAASCEAGPADGGWRVRLTLPLQVTDA